MPSPEQHRDRKVRRKINPATAPIEELLRYLAADPVSGLSQKEAERRLAASAARPLYRTPARSYPACLKRMAREPALWLLLAVSLISLFFDRIALGLICFLLAGGHMVLCALLLWRADRIDASFSAYDAPLSRVLRGRRIHRIGASELVRGDILIFHPGDMIPADCRLLRTEDFTVTEREIAADPDRPQIRLKKDADALPETAGNFKLSPPNMVFAGGVCESGYAIAVAVAVGSETHLGGLTGGLSSPHAGRNPEFLRKATRYLSLYNLGLICLILPVTAVGIFSLGDRYELLDIFLSTLALAGLTLTEHVLAKGIYQNAMLRRAAAVDRDTANTADIRSATAPETIVRLTDLILVGSAALHDGQDHAETLLVGDRLYRIDRPESDDEARAAAELFYLCRHGMLAYPSVGEEGEGSIPTDTLVPLADRLADWAEMDTDALLVRAKELRPETEGISAILPTPSGNARVTVRVTADFEETRACRACRQDGMNLPLTEERRDGLYRAYREAIRTGKHALFLITRSGGESAVRAMLTYAPHTCRKTAGAIRSLESAGIRVSVFLRDASDVSLRALSECGFSEPRSAADIHDSSAVSLLDSGSRAFTACDTHLILHTIQALKEQGRTVAVLSSDREDTVLLSAADLAVTCSPSLFTTAEGGHPRLPTRAASPRETLAAPDGTPHSPIATDLCRRRADVVVRRTSSEGGGVVGLRRAILCADRIRNAVSEVFGFLLLSQAARLGLTVLPLLLGLSALSAPALLVSGLGVDLLILLSAVSLPLSPAPEKRSSMAEVLKSPHLTHRNGLIAMAAATAVPTLIAAVWYYLAPDMGGDPAHFLCLCLLGLQTVVYRLAPLPRRDRTVFFTTLTLVLIYVAALAVALGAGLGLILSLVLPLLSPALYLAVKLILDRVTSPK